MSRFAAKIELSVEETDPELSRKAREIFGSNPSENADRVKRR
jgi:hypothetical protein